MKRIQPASTMPATQVTRRQMIERLGGGLGLAGLLPLLNEQPASATPARFVPRAKRVIHLFMNGGPFQADFFDPKPLLTKHQGERPQEVDLRTERATAGLLASPFSYAQYGSGGLPISELLPNLSKCADDLCILRSLYTDNPNHGPALYQMNNGTITPRRPSMGSWFLYGLGSENQNLPGYVVLCPGRPVRFSELWTSAFLPAQFQGTYLNHSNLAPDAMIPFLKNGVQTTISQRRQLDLLQGLNQEHLAERGVDSQLDARIRSLETAFRMQTEAAEAFDINLEPKHVRAEYGEGKFAEACLLSRRLAERGVRFTQIYYGNGQPWDTHNNHHGQVRNLAKTIDQPIAALLTDLKRTGLLDDTLVIWGGEFGRTPTSENGDGRDHNHYGFTMWLAGGGVRGGLSYGETDDFGFRAVHNKVHIHDLHATILYLLGIDHEKLTYRYSGRDFRLTDVHGRILRELVT